MATKIIVIKDVDFSNVALEIVEPKSIYYDISAKVVPDSSGTVTGTGNKKLGTSVTLTATASQGYEFSHWTDGVTTNSRSIIVGPSDRTYTAIFKENL